MNCVIIDTAEAADDLKNYILSDNSLNLMAVCTNISDAEKMLSKQKNCAVFMDIDLRGENYIEFISAFQQQHHIVITTTKKDFAINAFDLGVKDYLLKPFSFGRFVRTVNRLKALPLENFQVYANYFFVKSNTRFEKIDTNSILYIEGLQNYITIQTETKKVITYSSLKSIESFLPDGNFLRVQKSFIISISKIDRIDNDDVVIGKISIPISRNGKEYVMKTILNNRLYKY